MSRRERAGGGDRGSVTAEAAVVLPVLLAVTAACLWLLAALAAQLRCVDAAQAGARAAALGQGLPRARALAASAAGAGASVVLVPAAGAVRILVTLTVRPAGGLLRHLPPIVVHGSASAPLPAQRR